MFLDVVVINGDSGFADLLIPGLVGLGGVLLGVLLTTIFELWRQATAAKSAARLIRMELVEHGVKIEKLANGHPVAGLPSKSAWESYKLTVAPLIPELRLSRLVELYSRLQDIEMLMKEVQPKLYALQPAEIGKPIAWDWYERARKERPTLRAIEAARTTRLILTLLKGQPVASEAEIRQEWGITDEQIEEIEARNPLRNPEPPQGAQT